MSLSEIRDQLRAVISIPVTPFASAERQEVDWAAFEANIDRQIEGGIRVLTPNGNTSEFFALAAGEAERAVATALEVAGDRALVMPGVGYGLDTAVSMARQAAQAGAEAIMVHEPVHPFLTREGWVEYHRRIAAAVPETGVICYLRRAGIDAAELLRLAELQANFLGVKFAVADVVAFAETVRGLESSELVPICGLAETWAPFFWPAGALGFTSGLVNVTTGISLAYLDALQTGRWPEVMRIWELIRPFETMRTTNQSALNVSVVKEAMHQKGYANRAVRAPLSPVSSEQRSQIQEMLKNLDAESCLLRAPSTSSDV